MASTSAPSQGEQVTGLADSSNDEPLPLPQRLPRADGRTIVGISFGTTLTNGTSQAYTPCAPNCSNARVRTSTTRTSTSPTAWTTHTPVPRLRRLVLLTEQIFQIPAPVYGGPGVVRLGKKMVEREGEKVGESDVVFQLAGLHTSEPIVEEAFFQVWVAWGPDATKGYVYDLVRKEWWTMDGEVRDIGECGL